MTGKLQSFFDHYYRSRERDFYDFLSEKKHIDAHFERYPSCGRTLLEAAIDARLSRHAIALLDKGANPNIQGYTDTLLIKAINTWQRDVVLKLLEKGADPDKVGGKERYLHSEWGPTPLIMAIKNKDRELVHALLVKKADPNRAQSCNNDNTPLELAIKNGLSDIALRLLDAGADPDPYKEKPDGICHIGGSYKSLLLFAIERGQTDVALKLIEKGADVNRETCRVIRVEEIYAPGAEYGEMITFSEHTPLGAAFKSWNFKVVNALLDAGARHDFISKKEQKSLGYRITGQFYRAAAGETKAAREKKELDDVNKRSISPSPPAR